MDDANAPSLCCVRRIDANDTIVDANLAAIGLMHAGKNFDECRFPGAVFAEQRRHLSWIEFQLTIDQRARTAEGLGDPCQTQDRNIHSNIFANSATLYASYVNGLL